MKTTVSNQCRSPQAYLLRILADLDEEPAEPFSRIFLNYSAASADADLPLIAEQWDHLKHARKTAKKRG